MARPGGQRGSLDGGQPIRATSGRTRTPQPKHSSPMRHASATSGQALTREGVMAWRWSRGSGST